MVDGGPGSFSKGALIMSTPKLLKQVVFYVMAVANGYHVVKNSTILDPEHPISNPKDAWDQAKRLAGARATRVELPAWADPPDGEHERSCYLCMVEINGVENEPENLL